MDNVPLTQTLLKELTHQRLKEAQILFKERKYSGSYYLAGYVIELSLKAVIAKNFKRYTIPEKGFKADNIYIHDFQILIKLAGVKNQHHQKLNTHLLFKENWLTVSQWNPDSRYTQKTKGEAQAKLEAIENETDGVLPWIKSHW
jgi:hypothetical protein